MPLSISEIGVKIAVEDGDPAASGDADRRKGGPAGSCGDSGGNCGQQLSDAQFRAIVEESVRAVLDTLKLREAR